MESENQSSGTQASPRKTAQNATLRSFLFVFVLTLLFDMAIALIALSYSASRGAIMFDTGIEKFSSLMGGSFLNFLFIVVVLAALIGIAFAVVEQRLNRQLRLIILIGVVIMSALFGAKIIEALSFTNASASIIIIALVAAQSWVTMRAAQTRNPNNMEEVKKDA